MKAALPPFGGGAADEVGEVVVVLFRELIEGAEDLFGVFVGRRRLRDHIEEGPLEGEVVEVDGAVSVGGDGRVRDHLGKVLGGEGADGFDEDDARVLGSHSERSYHGRSPAGRDGRDELR